MIRTPLAQDHASVEMNTPTTQAFPFGVEEAEIWEDELHGLEQQLMRSATVPDDVRDRVVRLTERVNDWSRDRKDQMSRELYETMVEGALKAAAVLLPSSWDPTDPSKRRELRKVMAYFRQTLRDQREQEPVREDVEPVRALTWLIEALQIRVRANETVGRVLGVNKRQVQRWLSPKDPAPIADEYVIKILTLGRITESLRHVYTGPGVVHWLETPRPELEGRSPATLLADTEKRQDLLALARQSRSMIAS
jgi:uncharacterized protein (DUF2384 family)